jgi:hypothetical protein
MEQSTYLHTCFVLLLLELFGADTSVVFLYMNMNHVGVGGCCILSEADYERWTSDVWQ